MIIPDGNYPAVAVPMEGPDGKPTIAQWGYSGEGDGRKKQVVIYFQITDGPQAGVKLPWFGFMGKASYERTLQALRYAGWKGNDLAKLGDLDQLVEIVVAAETWEGVKRSKIQWVNDANGGRAMKLKAPMSETEIREWSAYMAGHAKKLAIIEGTKVDRTKLKKATPGEEPATNAANGNGTWTPPSEEVPPPGMKRDDEEEIPFARCDVADVDRVRRLRWP